VSPVVSEFRKFDAQKIGLTAAAQRVAKSVLVIQWQFLPLSQVSCTERLEYTAFQIHT